MPEIAEVSRVVYHLRLHLQNRTISSVNALDDSKLLLTAKTGLTGPHFTDALQGKKVLDARQQGKYFWLVMDSPPHPLLHLGMTGWIKFKGDGGSGEYRRMKEKKERQKGEQADAKKEEDNEDGQNSSAAEDEEWPPRFWKFILKSDGPKPVEAAFVDARRFGAIRLIDAPADELRNTSPLKENGPDPVVDKGIVTQEWLTSRLQKKHVPIKAFLLDQAVLSGIGNWVADEVLYQARIHPEQYCNTLTEPQAKQLHKQILLVCTTACDLLADSSRFPETWLMKHRWDKGKQGGSKLPNGEKIVHLTVGGRTSAVVPSVQKKTGPVAGDVSDGEDADEKENAVLSEEPIKKNNRSSTTKQAKSTKGSKKEQKVNGDRELTKQNTETASKGRKRKSETKATELIEPKKKKATLSKTAKSSSVESGRRRSARLSGS